MSKRRGGWIGLAVVGALALALVAPFIYMVSRSLMEPSEAKRALTALPFARFFLNSALLAGCAVVGQVLTSAAAAYAFARLRFPGRDRVFLAFLSLLIVPAIVLLVPRFLIIDALGWRDSYAGLITTELVSVWGIFFLRQYFRTLPRDLEDAARLDGAGEWTIFWRVILPLSKPALVTLALLVFVDQWKNFLWPLVATRSVEMQVVEVGLARLHGLYFANWPYQMAAAVAVTLPLLVVCFVAQGYFSRALVPAASRSGRSSSS
jgi:multiple sugar transport system permease protein